MSILQNKIDFAVIVEVHNANANGDPLNGNMPRTTYEGYGEISDVCLKRKIRNRFIDMGEQVFVQADDKNVDGFSSLRERADHNEAFKGELAKGKKSDKGIASRIACEQWMDVRTFGQVFAFKGSEMSLGIRGPVSIHPAFSIEPIDVTSLQITKSVNSEKTEGGKASDTMGMKHRVDFGIYMVKGSINVQLAEQTGFTEEDADIVKEALRTLFINDSSSARPDGSMEVISLYWWKHNCKIGQYSSKKVHDSIIIERKEGVASAKSISDYTVTNHALADLEMEIIEGI
ncbi:MAG: type I-C CRISPR-associated protein Cas7/Csd2 [Lachnospiraceae bacterium]